LVLSKGSPLPFDETGSGPVPPRYWVVFFKQVDDSKVKQL